MFMELNNELYAAEQHLAMLQSAQLENGVAAGGVSLGQFELQALYAKRLEREIEAQELFIEELNEKVEEARQEFVEASQEEEALVTMKDNKLQEYNEYVTQEELKNLDEISTQRHARKNGKRFTEKQSSK